MLAKIISAFLVTMALSLSALAQGPTPVVVQAVPTAKVPAAVPVAAPVSDSSVADALKTLRDLKAANDETLKKQAATLQQLEELEKAAEQIKIYTKRG